jgi:serine/threonine-protein kinase
MTDELKPGEVIADKYRVERILGEGGMGYVVAAYHLRLEQKVALKFLKPEALKHPHIVQRFAREARAAAKIQGEHVARVVDVGELPNGAPYIVMEYLEGEDLAHRLHARGPLPVAEAVGYMLETCEALAEAHAAGIVHRDLKPPNLFLAKGVGRLPLVKILDFGISKALADESSPDRNLTSTNMIMGTPHYMSPEQLRSSRDVDARSDIWALGVVLFELLTGQPPFDGVNTTAVITPIIADPARPLAELRSDVPAELAAVISRCLAKFRAERFADVLELARALAPFAAERAHASLPRIEHILRPVHSNAPPPDTAPATELVLGSTRLEPMPTAPKLPTAATVDIAGQRAPETHATWDHTLPAAVAQPPAPSRGLLFGGAAALVAVGVAASFMLRSNTGSSAASLPASGSALPAAIAAERTSAPGAAPSLPAAALSAPAATESAAPAPPVAVASTSERAVPVAPALAAAPKANATPAPRKKPAAAPPDKAPAVAVAPPAASPAAATTGSLRMGIK